MKPFIKTSTKRRSPEASHFSQMPLSGKQRQTTARICFFSKQIGRANSEPNTMCKNSQVESGLPCLDEFSRNWKKDFVLTSKNNTGGVRKFPPRNKTVSRARAKMHQLQKEKILNPSTSMLCTNSTVPVPPLAHLGDW